MAFVPFLHALIQDFSLQTASTSWTENVATNMATINNTTEIFIFRRHWIVFWFKLCICSLNPREYIWPLCLYCVVRVWPHNDRAGVVNKSGLQIVGGAIPSAEFLVRMAYPRSGPASRAVALDLMLRTFMNSADFHTSNPKIWDNIAKLVPGTTPQQVQ